MASSHDFWPPVLRTHRRVSHRDDADGAHLSTPKGSPQTVVALLSEQQSRLGAALAASIAAHPACALLAVDAAAVEVDEDALAAAFGSAQIVVCALQHSPVFADLQLAALAAARKLRVQRFVPSAFGFPTRCLENHHVPYYADLARVEDALASAGVPWTCVHCGGFYEDWLSPAYGCDIDARRLLVPVEPNMPVSMTSLHDVAAMLPLLLQDESTANKHICVHGDTVSGHNVAALLEKHLKAPVTVEALVSAEQIKGEASLCKTAQVAFLALLEGQSLTLGETTQLAVFTPCTVEEYLQTLCLRHAAAPSS
eukprot:m.25300 g.25300  ORF g.25300 m.25300 type:complete len:311 (+) comp4412_c0_seq1:2943-3875(+)